MPVLDLQNQLGIDLDKWLLYQSNKQPYQRATMCHAFEKEWRECSDGIGTTRARKECDLEWEDLKECMTRQKMIKRMRTVLAQRKKMIKEGNYTLPNCESDSS
uniref:NADH dehydrogenase [ubiquinone] iron-sulfur protein 5 n=1 Tax=Ailuropoda melanoleuca TaxID=9646 RepID=A0A7N5K8Y9_AILME